MEAVYADGFKAQNPVLIWSFVQHAEKFLHLLSVARCFAGFLRIKICLSRY